MTSTSGRINTVAQFITVIIIFLFVLLLTYIATRWMANFQKGRLNTTNISVLETYKVTTNKYIQLVKTGEKYFAIAVCKDTITLLGELEKDDIIIPDPNGTKMAMSFSDIFDKAKKFKAGK